MNPNNLKYITHDDRPTAAINKMLGDIKFEVPSYFQLVSPSNSNHEDRRLYNQ